MNGFAKAAAVSFVSIAGCMGGPSKKEVAAQSVSFALSDVRNAIDLYALVERRLPASLSDLTKSSARSGEPVLKSVPTDPWGQDFQYSVTKPEGMEYEIRSSGPDKKFGTEDDIVARGHGGG